LFDTLQLTTKEPQSHSGYIVSVSKNEILIQCDYVSTVNPVTSCYQAKKLFELAPDLVIGKQYTLTMETTAEYDRIYLIGANKPWFNKSSLVITKEMLESDVMFYCTPASEDGVPVYTTIKNIQIEEGYPSTNYEPYTGGIPAPNPLYPIEPVFSNQTKILSCGKNLLDLSTVEANGTRYGIITRQEDSIIYTPSPEDPRVFGITIRNVEYLIPGNTYTFHINVQNA
jgi:hypothetical protein